MGGATGPLELGEFDYHLPPELIAREPARERHDSRLLLLDRRRDALEHHRFHQLDSLLEREDVLVINDTRVIAARLHVRRGPGEGPIEVLLLEESAPGRWWVMIRPGRKMPPGMRAALVDPREGTETGLHLHTLEKDGEGRYLVRFEGESPVSPERHGEIPLPPYIEREEGPLPEDAHRYQTVYARHPGSVAAPTAGLHFTGDLLARLRDRGHPIIPLTLHIGAGTFAPIRTGRIADHRMHEERFRLSETSARALTEARARKRRIVAVGTTSLRVLETCLAEDDRTFLPGEGRTRLYVHPPWRFRATDALLTNFHLPRSSLLLLVSAFASPGDREGIGRIRRAYAEARRMRYRFYSYGDAMFIR